MVRIGRQSIFPAFETEIVLPKDPLPNESGNDKGNANPPTGVGSPHEGASVGVEYQRGSVALNCNATFCARFCAYARSIGMLLRRGRAMHAYVVEFSQ